MWLPRHTLEKEGHFGPVWDALHSPWKAHMHWQGNAKPQGPLGLAGSLLHLGGTAVPNTTNFTYHHSS